MARKKTDPYANYDIDDWQWEFLRRNKRYQHAYKAVEWLIFCPSGDRVIVAQSKVDDTLHIFNGCSQPLPSGAVQSDWNIQRFLADDSHCRQCAKNYNCAKDHKYK